MKKMTKRVVTIAGVFIITIAFLLNSMQAAAGTSNISTNGNIDFENGIVGIYADDFNYLQDEIDALFNEIN